MLAPVYAACTNLRLLRAWARRILGDDDLIPILSSVSRPGAGPRRPASDDPDTGPPPGQ
jgi:hypothetical protein